MPAILLTIIRTGAVWLGRIGLAFFAVNEFRKFYNKNETTFVQADQALTSAGVSDDEKKQLVAAFTYDKVESEGEDPDDFWAGLTPKEKETLEFSPESLRNSMGRTKFLGLASEFLFFAALLASGVAAVRGIPIVLRTLATLRDSRAAGATAAELMTIIEEGKLAAISKVWAPAAAGTFLGASGWWSASMANNFNDAELWGRVFLGQAADDFAKASEELSKQGGNKGSGTGTNRGNITIIRMAETKEPTQFIGTLFSSKLGRVDSFERKVDDEITSMDDLREDVKVNLNRWLASLPNRMGYSVVVRKDPVDEFGVKQSGIWATLTMFITHISGKTTPIDTILLGPVDPKTRLELQRSVKTVESEIEGFIDAATVREITVPNGVIDIFNEEGDRVLPSGVVGTPASTTTTPTVDTTQQPGETTAELKARLEKTVKDLQGQVSNLQKVDTGAFEIKSVSDAPAGYTTQRVHNTLYALPPEEESSKSTKVERNAKYRVEGTNSCLNVRSTFSTSGEVYDCLPDGADIEATGLERDADGYHWLQVRFMGPRASGTGWMADQYLRKI